MERTTPDSFNSGFVQEMYENYLSNPGSVSVEWRKIFELQQENGHAESRGNGRAAQLATNGSPTNAPAPANAAAKAAPAAADALPDNAQQIRGPAAGLVRNMDESLTVPTATTFRTLRMSALEQQRKVLNDALKPLGRKLSFTHIIAWAIVEATHDFPVMAHTYAEVDGKPYRIANDEVNFGLAVDVEKKDGTRGLMVPCIQGANRLSVAEFFERYDDLVARARTGKLTLEDFAGTNLTLTNPGGLGTIASVPRLMAGQGTIVATGAIAFPPEFQDSSKEQLAQLGVSKVMTMTSTYDHRVIQGAESGAFLRRLDQLLQGEDEFYEFIREGLGIGPDGIAHEGAVEQGTAPQTPPAEATGSPEVANAASDQQSSHSIMLEPGASLGPDEVGDEFSEYQFFEAAKITVTPEQLASVAAAMALVKAHRTHGHLAARLDPLGSDPPGDPSLDPHTVGLSDDVMRTIPASVLRIGVAGETLADALPRLREKYCGTIAYEIEHISDHDERVWLRRMIESGEHRRPLSTEEKRGLLKRLTDVEVFERFVRRAYLTQKQFSIEGVDMLVPMLDEAIELAAAEGAHSAVMGMAHRGRLNVLAHIMGISYESILREFESEGRLIEDTALPEGGTGDVKYHIGATGGYKTATGEIELSLAPNPSHLEAVDPVVVGRTRAQQTLRRSRELHHDGGAALPILIHGDAAFPGQGVVAETLNLQALRGYRTGGTVHIITNNQLGFTTTPDEGRSTRYASDLAKGFDVPIIHVNADDAEACLAAVRLAMAFRTRFQRDVLIDLVGYRRHGHNEGDEPTYTQPRMYAIIKGHERVRERFARQLVEQQLISEAEVKQLYDEAYASIGKLHEAKVTASEEREATELDQPTGDFIDRSKSKEPTTGVAAERLRTISDQLLQVPDGFTVHPKLAKQLERRPQMFEKNQLDWALGEALAFGSLLADGIPIRLTGQDSERGTFSHRQMVLHDANTGERYSPVQNLPLATSTFEIHNSPLSENACMGFEYGYSVSAPDVLVLWEAQFGDFVNGAQVVLDQFVMSGLAKWGATSRLTLLLPHGYEGNGPEHSNGRLSRFLAGAAEGNVRVANCTSAAQYFHLLRRQALTDKARPLIVMTPKSLLRSPLAASPIEQFEKGRFEWILDDPRYVQGGERHAGRDKVERLVLCTGKLYYDIAGYKEQPETTAVIRVELLYPFPRKQISELVASYPNVREIVWAQEEPQNLGAYVYMRLKLPSALPEGMDFGYAGRYKRSSTSEGYGAAHLIEQQRIVRAALALD